MSDTRDPDRDQVAPTPNDGPSCHDLVIADMAERKQFGLRKYNNLLQPNNGRSFLQDAYEEILDLAVYLRGKLEEERNELERTRRSTGQYRILDPRGSIWPINEHPNTNDLLVARKAMMPGHILYEQFETVANRNVFEWRPIETFEISRSALDQIQF